MYCISPSRRSKRSKSCATFRDISRRATCSSPTSLNRAPRSNLRLPPLIIGRAPAIRLKPTSARSLPKSIPNSLLWKSSTGSAWLTQRGWLRRLRRIERKSMRQHSRRFVVLSLATVIGLLVPVTAHAFIGTMPVIDWTAVVRIGRQIGISQETLNTLGLYVQQYNRINAGVQEGVMLARGRQLRGILNRVARSASQSWWRGEALCSSQRRDAALTGLRPKAAGSTNATSISEHRARKLHRKRARADSRRSGHRCFKPGWWHAVVLRHWRPQRAVMDLGSISRFLAGLGGLWSRAEQYLPLILGIALPLAALVFT